MCEYCDLENYKRDDYLDSYDGMSYIVQEGQNVCLRIVYSADKKRFYIDASDYGVGHSAEIHYCPFCGRKLDEEEDNGEVL